MAETMSVRIRIEHDRVNGWVVFLEAIRGYIVGSGRGIPLVSGLPNRPSATQWWLDNKRSVLTRYAPGNVRLSERTAPGPRDRVR